jgi:hypothetical protein
MSITRNAIATTKNMIAKITGGINGFRIESFSDIEIIPQLRDLSFLNYEDEPFEFMESGQLEFRRVVKKKEENPNWVVRISR